VLQALGFSRGATSITVNFLPLAPGGCFKGPKRHVKSTVLEFDNQQSHDDWAARLESIFTDAGKILRPSIMTSKVLCGRPYESSHMLYLRFSLRHGIWRLFMDLLLQ
jgi:hypothetical protein